jgi:hypothetical protein
MDFKLTCSINFYLVSNLKYRNLIISGIIIVFWAGFVLLSSSRSTSEYGNSFNLFIWLMLTRYFALITGVAFLILRILRIVRHKDSLFYILIGSLNCSLGVLLPIIYAFTSSYSMVLQVFLLNLLIGVLIFIDIYKPNPN